MLNKDQYLSLELAVSLTEVKGDLWWGLLTFMKDRKMYFSLKVFPCENTLLFCTTASVVNYVTASSDAPFKSRDS